MKRALILLIFLPFLLAQIAIGSPVALVLICAVSLLIGFAPLIVAGRDLYAILCAIFVMRYVGIALIAKTAYGQPLDSNLHDPLSAYTLSGFFLATVTLIFITARQLDRRTALFGHLPRLEPYRRVGLLAAIVGGAAQLVVIAIVSRRSGTANTGAAYVIAFYVSKLYLLGLASECIYNIKASSGRQWLSMRLSLMLIVAVAMTLLLNIREFFIDCAIVVAVTAFLHKSLKWRDAVVGCALLAVGSVYLSPMVLALRSAKYGKTSAEFIESAGETAFKTLGDAAYRDALLRRQQYADRLEKGSLLYDYYGDGSNILNRLSYVGLVDAVFYATRNREPIGVEAAYEVKDRVMPRFLNADKRSRPYEYGDWLCWKTGLMESGRIFAANFGLPMEGLAVAGIAGFFLFPVVFLFPLMLLITRVASFREPMAASIFFFASFQHPLMEAASDGVINIVTRALPIMVSVSIAIYWIASLRFTGSYERSRSTGSALGG